MRLTDAGIRRSIGTASQGKAPRLTEDVRRMVDSLPANRKGVRDRALLLVGFAGAFRGPSSSPWTSPTSTTPPTAW